MRPRTAPRRRSGWGGAPKGRDRGCDLGVDEDLRASDHGLASRHYALARWKASVIRCLPEMPALSPYVWHGETGQTTTTCLATVPGLLSCNPLPLSVVVLPAARQIAALSRTAKCGSLYDGASSWRKRVPNVPSPTPPARQGDALAVRSGHRTHQGAPAPDLQSKCQRSDSRRAVRRASLWVPGHRCHCHRRLPIPSWAATLPNELRSRGAGHVTPEEAPGQVPGPSSLSHWQGLERRFALQRCPSARSG